MIYLNDRNEKYIEFIKYYTSKGIHISRKGLIEIYKDSTTEPQKEYIIKLLSLNTELLHHKVIPFYTVTGRDNIKGGSITGITKKLWKTILSPPEGYVYALYDFCQQEPAIAACFAGDHELFEAYKSHDLYEVIGLEPELETLSRTDLKKLVLPYLYGQRIESYCLDTGSDIETVRLYFKALNRKFHKVNHWLNQRCQQAFMEEYIHCLDWQMKVTQFSNPLTIRNWPIQAAGADILRRACLGLFDKGIDLRLTNHDSFLVQIKVERFDMENQQIINILQNSCKQVLFGKSLNVKLEAIYESHCGVKK